MAENQIKLLHTLRSKTELLIKRCDDLKSCNRELERQATELERQLETKDRTIEALHKELENASSKYETLKLARRLPAASLEERKQMKLRVNGLVREIDKCITLLNGTMQ